MNEHDLGLLRSTGLDADIRRNKSVPPPSALSRTPAGYHPSVLSTPAILPGHRAKSTSKSSTKSKSTKGIDEAEWNKAVLASQQHLAYYSAAGLVSPQAAAFQFYAAQLQAKGYEGFNMPKLIPGANGDYMPPFMNHPQLLEHMEVQRRLAMITQQQQQSASAQTLKHPTTKDAKHHHITLKSSVANGGASAFRPVHPKDKSKNDRLKKTSESCPPRCSSVPAQKSDQVKCFPFSWDRKAHATEDVVGNRHPSLHPYPGLINTVPGPGGPIKIENNPVPTANESSSSTDGLRSDAVTAAANRGALAAWHNHVKKMPIAKQRLFMREAINSDSSIPQSPISSCSPVLNNQNGAATKRHEVPDKNGNEMPGPNIISTPLTTESDCEIVKRNETDDEKLKKSIAAAVATLDPPPDLTKPSKDGDLVVGISPPPMLMEPRKPSPVEEPAEKPIKKVNPSPLPLKKRRLHAVIADALNQSVQSDASSSTASSRTMSPVPTSVIVPVTSSSDSDIPLAMIREKLHKAATKQQPIITPSSTPPIATPPISDLPKFRLRKEDFITDIEESLRTFRANVATPEATESSTSSASEESVAVADENNAEMSTSPHTHRTRSPATLKRGRPIKKVHQKKPTTAKVVKPRIKRMSSSSTLDPRELQQLAKFMLSSSEDDEDDSQSESDDDYRSRAFFDSDVERRQTRSPGSMTKSKPSPKRSPKKSPKKTPAITEQQHSEERKRPAKRSLESVLKRVSDMKKTQDTDDTSSPPNVPKKQRKQPSPPLPPPSNHTLEKFFAAEKEMDAKSADNTIVKKERSPKVAKSEPRKRKSNTPRKLEILPQDNWEHSQDTVVDKNSSEGKDYLIAENDASWYSVTCFCGGPFAGRPMIECDNCGMWVHMACGKIKQNKVPDQYNCPTCRRDKHAVPTRNTPSKRR